MTSGLRGVLFDMDGTLLDSELLWDRALADTAGWLGGELSAPARQAMVGSNIARSVSLLHADLGVAADPGRSAAYLLNRTAALFAEPIAWRPGARELLEAVRLAGLPTALVTSTHRMLTNLALRTLGAANFAVTVCGDEVTNPKPHPEPYLRGAQLLGVPISQCLAVEDSPTGLAAAEAAGCTVLAVPCAMPIEPTPRRTIWPTLDGRTVDDLADLMTAVPPTTHRAPGSRPHAGQR